jgi:hypothetical protein
VTREPVLARDNSVRKNFPDSWISLEKEEEGPPSGWMAAQFSNAYVKPCSYQKHLLWQIFN